ncbi:MAG: glycosyltransferase family 4 protein [Gammaproteobacteria bacterium]|nr:glycosyltransferase family 4 protein [Gammaproteobacteria bacterium]
MAGIKWKILKWIYNKLINQCDAIIVPSLYLCRIVKGWGIDTAKINVVYNSVKPQSLPYANYGEGGNVDCVTVARLVPWKGISELIDVVCENKWTLNVIGDGPLKEDLVCRALKHSNNSVQFLGYVPRDQVHSEISKAKIFILNSTYEGLPHIVLEAKQAGVAVIATAVGGTPETITDGVDGYLIPPGDNAMLREKIGYLLSNNDKRTQVASKGREQVLHNFSFETMATKTEKILENTLNR